jgi:hypothetical protein
VLHTLVSPLPHYLGRHPVCRIAVAAMADGKLVALLFLLHFLQGMMRGVFLS